MTLKNLYPPPQQDSQFSSTKQSMTEQEIQDNLVKFGPLSLIQMSQFFVLISQSQPNPNTPMREQQVILRGTIYLLKLARLLCKFEKAPAVCYIYKEVPCGSFFKHQQQSVMKIENLLQLHIDYPSFEHMPSQPST
jgi:hypothetical protein